MQNQLTLSGQSEATALFSTVRYTLCDIYVTFRSLSIPESQFSKTYRRKAILRGKGHLTETARNSVADAVAEFSPGLGDSGWL
jgi:hypothetical protein